MSFESFWIAAYLIATAWFVPPLGHGLYRAGENFFSRLAAKPTQSMFVLFSSTIVLRLLLLTVFHVPQPYAHDEFCYLLQADMFAHGRLAYPPHPMAAYLETFYVNFHPTYSTIFSPGQSFVLAVGQWLGHPWIGVLLSTAAMVVAFYWMLMAWIPARWAFLGAVVVLVRIALFSYWMNSYWGGSVAALGALLVLGALPRLKHSQRAFDAFLLGLGVFTLANSRPLEGFIFCIPVAVMMLFWLFDLHKLHRPIPAGRVLLPIFLCVLGLAVFIPYDNWRVSGDPFTIPRDAYYKQWYSVSPFIWGKIGPPQHYDNPQFAAFFNGWMRDQYNRTWASLKSIELLRLDEFWLFFMGTIFTVSLLGMPWVLRNRRMRPLVWWFLFCALGLTITTWSEPHMAAPAFCVFLILAMQAFRYLRTWRWRRFPVGVSLTRQLVTLTLLMLPVCIYEHIRDPHGIACWSYAPEWPRSRTAAELEKIPGDHLVIVRYPEGHDYRDQWGYNDADIDHSRIVWAHDAPGRSLEPLLAYFANRKVWICEPDAVPPKLYEYEARR